MGRAFLLGIGLNAGFVVLEIIAGLAANSVALLADAGHNLSDVLGLVVAAVAVLLSRRLPSPRFTYGLGASSILAALLNAMLLLVAVGALAWEAIGRFTHPAEVGGPTMMVVAGLGILVNGGTALLFLSGRKGDLNVRGAFLHMVTDAAVSAGVVIGGFVILMTGWTVIDPILSLLIAVGIFASTWDLLKDAVGHALHGVPEEVDPGAVRQHLLAQPGVASAHDLHIWPLSTSEIALTAHLVMPAGSPGDAALFRLQEELHDLFGIGHATLQVETGPETCPLAPDHVV